MVVVALSQEDTDLASFGRMPASLPPGFAFEVLADLGHEQTGPYDRTSTYWIDRDGVVAEVFPAMTHIRPSWDAVLRRIDERRAAE